MNKGSVNFVTILLAAIIVAGGFYFLVYQPRHQTVPTASQTAIVSVTPTNGIVNTTPTSSIDETTAVLAAVKAAIEKEHGADANGLTYTVKTIEGNYAEGAANAEHGGGMWFAAKVNGVWGLVWDGNGEVLCSDLTAYPDFPKTMISQCYNDKTNTMVTR